ncbi:MAG: hypothetical protein L6R38_001748 [Xanthoria sp. 2 TBL-2021]|nr:MAG: hypothetical protein L6R38_001748 [Xanthoria sp. 2 TBL-2021]
MTSLSQDDPFLEAQADVLSTLNTTRSLYSSYVRIRSLASSASSPELAQARSELETTLLDLTSDLQDLVDSVKAIESDPFRYGVDINEVARRRKLVEDVGREVEDMGKELKNVANNQNRDGVNGSTLPPPSAFDPDVPELDDYEAFEQQRQVEIMHEQDEALDGVFKTVGNLRQQANDMGRELEEQHVMLDEVETLGDRVGGKLQTGIKKVGWVIKKNEETMSSCCIVNSVAPSSPAGIFSDTSTANYLFHGPKALPGFCGEILVFTPLAAEGPRSHCNMAIKGTTSFNRFWEIPDADTTL